MQSRKTIRHFVKPDRREITNLARSPADGSGYTEQLNQATMVKLNASDWVRLDIL